MGRILSRFEMPLATEFYLEKRPSVLVYRKRGVHACVDSQMPWTLGHLKKQLQLPKGTSGQLTSTCPDLESIFKPPARLKSSQCEPPW